MPGYKRPRPEMPPIKLPVKLPEQLRGEQYAFVTLPAVEFMPGGAITDENIGFGSLCPLPRAQTIPEGAMVPGLAIFSRRSSAIAAWLAGTDLAYCKAVLESRELLIEVGLDTQYLLARVRDAQQQLEAQVRLRTPPPARRPGTGRPLSLTRRGFFPRGSSSRKGK